MAIFSFSSTDSFRGLDGLNSTSTHKILNSLKNTSVHLTGTIKANTEKLPLIEEVVKNNPTEITKVVLEDNGQIKQSLTALKQDLAKIVEGLTKNETVWATNLKHIENILLDKIDEEWVKLVKTLKIAELFPIMRCLNELEDIFICDKFSTTDKNPSSLKSQCKKNMQDKLSANENLLKDLEVLYVNWDKNLNIDEQRLERMAKLQIFKRKVIVYLLEIADNGSKAKVDIVQPPNNAV